MIRARFALLAMVVGLAACGGPAIPPAQPYATITGRVYDAATNEPIAGVTVTGSVILTATSASDGTYKIPNFPIGPNEVQVTAPPGYTVVQPQYAISPQKGETLKLDIALKKNP